jgi:hypothetical protein
MPELPFNYGQLLCEKQSFRKKVKVVLTACAC